MFWGSLPKWSKLQPCYPVIQIASTVKLITVCAWLKKYVMNKTERMNYECIFLCNNNVSKYGMRILEIVILTLLKVWKKIGNSHFYVSGIWFAFRIVRENRVIFHVQTILLNQQIHKFNAPVRIYLRSIDRSRP